MSAQNDIDRNGTFYGSIVSLSFDDKSEESKHSAFSTPTPAKVWGFGLLFVTIISFSAAIGIALMPLLSKRTYNRVLVYFVGLGVGSLSGSAIFHLLPQAFEIVSTNSTSSTGDDSPDSAHSYLFKCWMAIGGIYLFFLVDKFIKLFTEWKKVRKTKLAYHKHQANGQSNGHISNSLPSEPSYTTITNITTDSARRLSVSDGTFQDSLASSAISMQISPVVAPKKDNFAKISNGACGHDHAAHIIEGQSVIATVAWMVIFGDGLHNFVDGLSIGAAFTESILSGISISVAVICEEFPHELGDVAILISSGMSLRQALFYNLLSAFTCYLGFIIGVLVGELSEASVYIFAFAGGMFLYISLGNMVPEMNNVMEKALGKSVKKAFYVLLVQSAGILTGLVIMFIMSYFGDKITFS